MVSVNTEILMKTACSIILALAVAAVASAQTKPGDFKLDPLPPQQQRFAMKTRATSREPLSSIRPCSTDICSTSLPHACVEIEYPETAWRTCVSNQGRRGLVVGPTDLRRSPNSPWMRVLREASVAEIFVPYHSFTFRLYDFQAGNAQSLLPINPVDVGANGSLITLSEKDVPQVAAEVNDRGIAWLCKNISKSIVRRGQEMVLWGVYDAQNYDFIIDYRFRDDGSIGFRLGATGFNNPYFPPLSTTDAHMHSVLWRVDVDLNGAENDSAVLVRHLEEGSLLAQDVEQPFNGGTEGAIQWEPQRFLSVGVEDSSTNVHGPPIGYMIRTTPEGLSRHYGENAGLPRRERFTQSDLAVTRYKTGERNAFFDTPNTRWLDPDEYLLGLSPFTGTGISDAESITNTDVVLWNRASVHHDPHDEDHAPGDPANLMTGITLVHWAGFDLEPHNLFDFNPLGGPSRTNCQ